MRVLHGDGETDPMQNVLAAREHGELGEKIDELIPKIGLLPEVFKDLGLDLLSSIRLSSNLQQCRYKVVDGDSIATDFGVKLDSDLPSQLAHAQGIDMVKVHLNVFGHMKEAARNLPRATTTEARDMTWAWEIGRCAGNLIHRAAVINRSSMAVARIGMVPFLKKVAAEISSDAHEIAINQNDIPIKAVEQYYQGGLPERLSSAIGSYVLQRCVGDDGKIADTLNESLWKSTTRPLLLASEFGTDFRPQVEYRDLAAASPLETDELEEYLERIME